MLLLNLSLPCSFLYPLHLALRFSSLMVSTFFAVYQQLQVSIAYRLWLPRRLRVTCRTCVLLHNRNMHRL
jgi:hypothetical protein